MITPRPHIQIECRICHRKRWVPDWAQNRKLKYCQDCRGKARKSGEIKVPEYKKRSTKSTAWEDSDECKKLLEDSQNYMSQKIKQVYG